MFKIFLVDDESSVRESLRDNVMWQQYGFQLVGEAADGEMALPLIRKLNPDLLVTDIAMPFMDGLALSRIVKQEIPHIKMRVLKWGKWLWQRQYRVRMWARRGAVEARRCRRYDQR